MKKIIVITFSLILVLGLTLGVSAAPEASSESTVTVNAEYISEITGVTDPYVNLDAASDLNGSGSSIDMDTSADITFSANNNWELEVSITSGATFSNTSSGDDPVALADVLKVNDKDGIDQFINTSGIIIATGTATDTTTVSDYFTLDLSTNASAYGNKFFNEFTQGSHTATVTYTIVNGSPL